MARKLAVNVAFDQVIYGPDYPQNGDLPEGAKVGDHCFEGSDEEAHAARTAFDKGDKSVTARPAQSKK